MGRFRPVLELKICAETLLGAYYDPPDPYPTPLDPEIFIEKSAFLMVRTVQAERRVNGLNGPNLPMGGFNGAVQAGSGKRFWVRIMTPQTHTRPHWTQKFSSNFSKKVHFLAV